MIKWYNSYFRIHDILVGNDLTKQRYSIVFKNIKSKMVRQLCFPRVFYYYVMLCKYEHTQQMVNPDRNKDKDKKVLKVDDQEDYEKSGFKSMMDNVEETKKRALESVPQIPRGQIPSGEEVTKELLDGSSENKKEAKKHIRKSG
jgi:hypothetical protein